MKYCTPCDYHNLVIETLRLTPNEVIEKCCEFLEIDINKVKSKERYRNYVDARNMISDMLYSDKYLNVTKSAIGKLLGNRDHTTILHGMKTLRDQLEVNKDYRDKYIKMHLFVYNTTKYFIWTHE